MRPERVALDPIKLPLPVGDERVEYRTTPGVPLFGALRDAAPDQWGRDLMVAAAGRPLSEYEFLAASSEYRFGNLAFGSTPDRPERMQFWTESSHIDAVLGISEGIEELITKIDTPSLEAEFMRRFIDRGSSLGGSRPKATVFHDERLWLAKFNAKNDPYNMAVIEYATMKLAEKCGLKVPRVNHLHIDGRDIFLIERFDRKVLEKKNKRAATDFFRIGVISGMTLFDHLNLSDARHAAVSYKDMADHLRRLGSHHTEDRKELFRRMVYNMICGNNDDHLRNFSFVREPDGHYRLSPAYDIMPFPTPSSRRFQILRVGDHGTEATRKNGLSWPLAFGFKDLSEAQKEMDLILEVTAGWREFFLDNGVSTRDIKILKEGHCFTLQEFK
jgi:serine/threonine-protein kinase HipA